MLGRADETEAMKGVIERHYISRDKIREIKNIADKDNCYQYFNFYEKICKLLEE